ncbi:SMI1/KNR4 family protein [Kitasatospora cineracea]|uniref:SMI1/KNR4 family protein n=1 Tax=Kitasatospora cineracea TaxID=88074 RepID=UPI0038093493
MKVQAVSELLRLVPPCEGYAENIDWGPVEADLGRSLPSDYKEFMRVYGAGNIGEEFAILSPPGVGEGAPWSGSMAAETENVRHAWEREDGRSVLDAAPSDLLAWGVTSGPDVLCWAMTGDDPEKWPTVVHRRSDPVFSVVETGMAEFLRCLFAGEFEDWPIRLAKNFLLPAPAFVHRRLWDERQEAGLDPVTGLEEPGRYTF